MNSLFKTTLVAVSFILAVAVSTQASLNASDNAGNYTSGDWTDSGSPNFGTGWGGAWTLSAGGIFFGSSTNNAFQDANSGIDSVNNAAWGLQASSGFTASAVRPFSGNLTIGQSVV